MASPTTDTKISALDAAAALDGAELMHLVQSGGNVQAAINLLAAVGKDIALALTNKILVDFSNTILADGLHIQVRNESGSEMSKGDVVYISGFHIGSTLPQVSLADANGASTFPAIGLVAGTIANNAAGEICISCRMLNLVTDTFSVGDDIYLSITPGAYSTKPVEIAAKIQHLGIVLRSHATLGVVEITNVGALDTDKKVVGHLVLDDSQNMAVADGAGDFFWRVPETLNGMDLIGVAASNQTAGVTGTCDIQVRNVTQAADMLSTKITIDTGEIDSKDAATPAVIDAANDDVATGDQIRFDVDVIHTTPAKGLLVELTFQLP